MEPFSNIVEQTNRVGVGFLLVELDSAHTFLDVAETTTIKETARRNRDHAHQAYLTILRYMGRVRLEQEEEARFQERLALLRQRLIEAGYPI